ncbi:CBS domain containing-hemolysin-like protein [Alkalihalobacillus xiaoxiensis]|uniref:CBS domain containing-hemolysin-like protein n=1 Tax=Shouchella xiaoxiensis TaxID=766895 RepID=A0ABS2SUN6_9BACI|nr:hemolysin family protein [Shouchella xiaoxiensis]MBM7839189.1 CBS domain containing-hemolysin-like protein [Shouchella xiaoxiensis]
MDLITLINLILLVILLALTAFFVASEFAVVKIRASRIEQLIAEGNKKAFVAKRVTENLDYYLSACQLGITVTALGLGALGKPAVSNIMYPVFDYFNVPDSLSSVISYAIAFLLVTYLHVVIGEMAPKTLAIQFSEKMTMLLASPLYWFGKIMFPFILTLNGASRLLLRMFGVKPIGHDQAYTEEELKIIMTQSYQGGAIDKEELQYMENVFSFDEHVAKDIMVPRTEIVAIHQDMTKDELVQVLDEHNYTRYPVIEDGDKDKIIGVVNAKKMLQSIVAGRDVDMSAYIRDLPYILEATSIQDVMLKMQQEKVHMAVIIDEYGGTSGIVTMEEVIEELVGEIRDEFDEDEEADIEKVSTDEYVVNGRVLLDDLEEQFGLEFDDRENVDTIGGWVQYKSQEFDEDQVINVQLDDHVWTVLEADNHQVKKVKFKQYIDQTRIGQA